MKAQEECSSENSTKNSCISYMYLLYFFMLTQSYTRVIWNVGMNLRGGWIPHKYVFDMNIYMYGHFFLFLIDPLYNKQVTILFIKFLTFFSVCFFFVAVESWHRELPLLTQPWLIDWTRLEFVLLLLRSQVQLRSKMRLTLYRLIVIKTLIIKKILHDNDE